MNIPNESKFNIGSKVRYISNPSWDHRIVRGFGYDKNGTPIVFIERSDGTITSAFEDQLIDVDSEVKSDEYCNKYIVILRYSNNKKVSYVVDIFAHSKEEAVKIAKETLIQSIGQNDLVQDDFKVKVITVCTAVKRS